MNIHDTNETIITALGGLGAAEAPSTLLGRVFSHYTSTPSPLGDVFVAFTDAGVQLLRPAASVHDNAEEFAELYRARFARPLLPTTRVPAGLQPALRGRPAKNLAFDLATLSEFERAVLAATRKIPSGQTRPYSWVAREAGHPKAVRAAGSVLARNPIPLLVPCHRVVRADGAVGQYIFGSARKEELLRAENVNLDEVAALTRAGVHYIGSDTTGIVCFPTCRDARRITPRHRHGFPNLSKAFAEGYRPCHTCRPAIHIAA
jgi:O-6-methylguanine DNA methyltransferase